MSFAIEVQTATGWHDDPSLLGPGCSESDNIWQTEDEALRAIDSLAAVGFDRSLLRVVEIDGYEDDSLIDAEDEDDEDLLL